MAITAGYDVGGAHLKVALTEGGRVVAAVQIPCPLWLGLDRLDAAFRQAGPLTARARRHAVTMTGELCEIFPDRPTGVRTLVDRLVKLLGPETRIWMGPCGFGSAQEARLDPATVASTNFLASAELVAQLLGDGLLVDMGSTTTDIIPVVSAAPCPRGLTDGERLATSELVYTGLTRSDVATVAHEVFFKQRRQRLAAGNFATMADVRRVLGELPEGTDQHGTADRRGTSLGESVARLARAFGRDAPDATLDDWRAAARAIADRQMARAARRLRGGAHRYAGAGRSADRRRRHRSAAAGGAGGRLEPTVPAFRRPRRCRAGCPRVGHALRARRRRRAARGREPRRGSRL